MNQNTPEVKLASEQKNMAELRRKLARSDFFPELQAWSSYEWHGESHDYTGDNWGAGVLLKWNLFSGLSDAASLESANLDSKIASERERELQNALLLQLKSAYFQLQSAIEKKKVTAAALKHADENRRILADRYQEGLVTIQDSLQAESEYTAAQFMHLQNLYNVYTSYADLLSAVGRPQDIFSLETDSVPLREGVK
jgi:outer membrane protein TolC